MMNKQEMIDYIYEKIADKTLSFGCKIYKGGDRFCGNNGDDYYIATKNDGITTTFKDICLDNKVGHPVMIGDVLERIVNNPKDKQCFWYSNKIHILRDHKRRSIEEQTIECITFIYGLLQND